jgi:hypothetical protein
VSVVAPPEPPRQDELEALIREARARQRRRWLVGVAVLGAAAAVTLSVWAAVPRGTTARHTSPAPPAGEAVASCSAAQLRITLPRRFAGLGHVNGDLRFTNVSGSTCRLSGWPSVVAVEPSGKTIRAGRIPARAAWALNWPAHRAVRPVVLDRGRSAYAEIDGGDLPLGDGSKACPTARWLRVGAPGQARVSLSAYWPAWYYPLCSGIAVSPFFPHLPD